MCGSRDDIQEEVHALLKCSCLDTVFSVDGDCYVEKVDLGSVCLEVPRKFSEGVYVVEVISPCRWVVWV